MYLLGIDVGTTNSKAGLYDLEGNAVAVASRPTKTFTHRDGFQYYDPEQMWETVAGAIREAVEKVQTNGTRHGRKNLATQTESKKLTIAGIGITSMAESGLFVHAKTGEVTSPFLPWFDTVTQPQAEQMLAEADLYERFCATGLRGSFKLGLAKILWIREREPEALRDAVWLSASGYIAYRLTGEMAVDYTLGARTYAFRIDEKRWDTDWIRTFGLSESHFPQALPSDEMMGRVQAGLEPIGLTPGIPVTIAGHDHVCSAMAVGAIVPEKVYDSMGTAETLVGTLPEKPLGRREFEAGLSFGCHIARGRLFWMGGNSASGGSVEWLRELLGDPPLSYEAMQILLESLPLGPTGILYHPYLSGSGAPWPQPRAQAALIGLTGRHGRGDIIKAVLEGTAYQLEAIRREASAIAGQNIRRLTVVGGGTRNPHWLQIKADVLGCELDVPTVEEATMAGAAMTAGIAAGCYASAEEAVAAVQATAVARTSTAEAPAEEAASGNVAQDEVVACNAASGNVARDKAVSGNAAQSEAARDEAVPNEDGDDQAQPTLVQPDAARHAQYLDIYEKSYVPLARALRNHFA